MQKLKAIILLCVVAVISAATVLYGITYFEFYNIPMAEDVVFNSSQMVQSSEQTSLSSTENKQETATSSDSSQKPSVSSTVAVQQSEEVSGAIISKHIDPKTSAITYDNVYLKNTSGASVDIKDELTKGTNIKIKKDNNPQILIVHTHATESYMLNERDYYTKTDLSRSQDTAKNMIAIGEIIANKVSSAGISVLHDKTLHDYPTYTGSYTRSEATIKSYLAKHPSIKIVIDVHRDAISSSSDKVKLVTEVDGKKAAQVMLVMGSQTGVVTTYPKWRENLRLSMLFHKKIETMYPSLARPILLASKKYNQNLTNGSMLIEVGTEANTLDEAKYSASLVGNALAELLVSLK